MVIAINVLWLPINQPILSLSTNLEVLIIVYNTYYDYKSFTVEYAIQIYLQMEEP